MEFIVYFTGLSIVGISTTAVCFIISETNIGKDNNELIKSKNQSLTLKG